VGGSSLEAGGMQTFRASADGLGTMSAVVWFPIDLEPPVPVLVESPEWVRPGDSFSVVVGIAVDDEPEVVDLDIDFVDVTDVTVGEEGDLLLYDFACTASGTAAEGEHDIEVYTEDPAGNSATTKVGALGIDGTPPVVSAAVGEPSVQGNGFTWVTSGTPGGSLVPTMVRIRLSTSFPPSPSFTSMVVSMMQRKRHYGTRTSSAISTLNYRSTVYPNLKR